MDRIRRFLADMGVAAVIPFAAALGLPISKGRNYLLMTQQMYRYFDLPPAAVLLDVLYSFAYVGLLACAVWYGVRRQSGRRQYWALGCGIAAIAVAIYLSVFSGRIKDTMIDLPVAFTMGCAAAGVYILLLVRLLIKGRLDSRRTFIKGRDEGAG